MKKFKRIDECTVILESIIWSSNASKRTYMKSEKGYEIDSIAIDGIRYFPVKKA